MPFTQLTATVANHIAQSRYPNEGGMSYQEFQALCDKAAVDIKDYLNSTLLTELASDTDSASGADFIGITPVTGMVASTIQALFEEVVARLVAVADGVSGADYIGMTAITETGASATVQSVIEALVTRLKATTDSASGGDLIGLTTITGLTGNTLQSVLENFLAVLKAVTDSGSGADLIGMTAITETGASATVQSVIEALITKLKTTTDSASGADLVGATAQNATITATTVQGQLEQIYGAIVAGTGDVNGPASAIASDIVQFDGTTGKLIKGGVSLVTAVGSPGADTKIPTEAAVRAAIADAGGGDFSGPAGAVSGNIVVFSGITGKVGADSGLSPSGADANVITGTPGTANRVPKWNADGDLIEGYTLSGADATVISGTKGTTNYLAKWNVDGDLVDGPALSGVDATVISGTKGTSGDLAVWNADGDLVDGPTPPTGAIVGTTDAQTFTNKRNTPRVYSLTTASSWTIDADSYDQAVITALSSAVTVNAPSGTPTDGQKLVMRIKDNGSARAITWNSIFAAIGITLPSTTTANKFLYAGAIYNSTSAKWDVLLAQVQA